MLTRRRLKQVLRYDRATGIFIWRKSRRGVTAGAVAGRSNQKGHIQIKIDGILYSANRLAFFWMRGRWPKHQVDHRDVETSNNRWKNLREATNAQNCGNKKRYRNNTTGFKGVSFHRASGKYQASIRRNYQKIHLGLFGNPELAHRAYKAAAKEAFGSFARFQ